MAFPRSVLLLCLVLGAAVGAQAQGFSSRSTEIETPVLFFDNEDLDGGSQNFPVVLPPAGGCSPCENLVRSELLLLRCTFDVA